MTRGSALTILATTRSAEFANRIGSMLAKIEDVHVDTRIGDLPSVTGEELEALERADVLLATSMPTTSESSASSVGSSSSAAAGRRSWSPPKTSRRRASAA